MRLRRSFAVPSILAIVALVLVSGCGDDAPPKRGTPASAPTEATLTDEAGDCRSCAASEDIRGISMSRDGANLVLTVQLDAPPRDGDVIWVWPASAAVDALRFARADGTWRATSPAAGRPNDAPVAIGRGTRVRIELAADRAARVDDLVAASTGGGDRIPDQGSVRLAGGSARTVRVTGDAAERSERRIAQAQRGMERLDPIEQTLAVQLLARQQLTGTFDYEGTIDGAQWRMTIVVDGAGQRSRQDLYDRPRGDWLLRTSLIADASEERFCSPRATRRHERCVIDLLDEEPATHVLAMQHGAAHVTVVNAPARRVLGQRVSCLRVVATVPDGPKRGERCAAGDGALASFDYVDFAHTFTLTRRVPTVAASAFVMPRN